MSKERISIFIILFVGTVSCGGPAFRVTKAWDPKEAPFFDDGVDLVDDPSRLGGEWSFRYENEIDGRVNLADLIAEIEILSVQTMGDPEGQEARRIDVKIEKRLLGSSPATAISLFSEKEAPGHALIVRYESHLTGRFILFARWLKVDDGSIRNHFHLSPISEAMQENVKRRIQNRLREEHTALAAQKKTP